jgi:hypothetical protein
MDDCARDVRLDERVQLHLLKSGGMIRVDDSAALCGRVGVDGAERFRTASID